MRLAEVLAQKGKGIVSMWPHHTLADAVRVFDKNSVSSVVIVSRMNRPLGLITDRDVVHGIARTGAEVLMHPVTEVMTRVPTCAPETTVMQAMERMTADRIRHLVVMRDDEMLGIVSIGDLVKVRLDDAELEGRVLRDMAMGHIAAQ